MTDERFDQLLNEMRQQDPPAEQVAAATAKVWHELAGRPSPACAGFRPELGAYLSGELTESRRMLVEDHLSRCTHCRGALAQIRGEQKTFAMPQLVRSRFTGWTRWAVAAGVILSAFYATRDRLDTALAPSGPRATVVSVSGGLYRLTNVALQPSASGALQPGAELAEGDVVRTTAGSRATLRLADGSQVELNQRTELAVSAAWSGRTIRLDRGDVIVQAAKQRRGTLRVVARDSVASVKGTVFAVSSGSAGSLVSVVEGSVAVSQPGSERLLTAGQKSATTPSLDRIEVRQTVAWSQDAEKYYALLGELIQIEKKLAESPQQAPRTSTRLLPYLPAGVQVYVAIPNIGGTLREALHQFENRARDSAVLNEWWSSKQGQDLKQTLDQLQAVTPLLGEEMVFVLTQSGGEAPLLMAQIQPGREAALRDAIGAIATKQSEKIPFQIAQNLLLVSDTSAHLAAMAGQLGRGAASPFAAEIARRYQGGVAWLVGVDAATFKTGFGPGGAHSQMLGMQNMRYLFFEWRNRGGNDENEATLSFQGARTGLASWLAAPGSSGSGEYVSAEALAAFSASTRDPRQAVDELLATIGATGDLAAELRQFEAETGVSLRNDLAGALGTDFTVAIERPSLPIPGWVAAFEAVRPSALDDAVRRLVDTYNRKEGSVQITLAQETVNGRVWNSIKSGAGIVPAIHWTYDRGYLVASMDRALAARAIASREAGSSLVRSAGFLQRFPATSGLHHSGFFWLNPNGVLADLAPLISSPVLNKLIGSRDPLLVVLDGETERIHASSRTRLTSLMLDLMLIHQPLEGQPATLKKELKGVKL